MTTEEKPLAEWINIEQAHYQTRFDSTIDDGLLLPRIRSFFGLRFWHGLHARWVNWWLKGRLQEPMSQQQAKGLARGAGDVYELLALFVMSVLYAAVYSSRHQPGQWWVWVVMLLAPLLHLYRIVEILSVVAALHFSSTRYLPSSPMRVVLLTLMQYCEVAVAFASFYVVETWACSDPFKGLAASAEIPLYFSFVTIATVGYGDFNPEHPAGRVLVMCEILFGLLLLAVILQRVVSVSLTDNRDVPQGPTA